MLPPQPEVLSLPSAASTTLPAVSQPAASIQDPPQGFYVAACQVCSEVIFTTKSSGGQHTCCPLAGKTGVKGVPGKAPNMPSLFYFGNANQRTCSCMPIASKPSDAPFIFCPGCPTKGVKPVAHPGTAPFVTNTKGQLPPWKKQ